RDYDAKRERLETVNNKTPNRWLTKEKAYSIEEDVDLKRKRPASQRRTLQRRKRCGRERTTRGTTIERETFRVDHKIGGSRQRFEMPFKVIGLSNHGQSLGSKIFCKLADEDVTMAIKKKKLLDGPCIVISSSTIRCSIMFLLLFLFLVFSSNELKYKTQMLVSLPAFFYMFTYMLDVVSCLEDTAKKDIDPNKPELNDHIMHYVLAKYGNKNGREDESLIDIIGDDIWKTFFNQVWNKFLDVAVVVVREQAKESSKRDVQDVGKTKVSKLVATKVFEVDKEIVIIDSSSSFEDYNNNLPSCDELDSNSSSSDEFDSTSSSFTTSSTSVDEIVSSKVLSNGLLKWYEDETDEEEEDF
nr:hypothetical protein [Tanacetum cinerariifolium]